MATKDCTFFVDIDGRQVEMDFDGFRAYLMQDGVMATLAPDLTKKRGKKAGFTITAQKAEPTPARAEAAPVRAEAPKARAEAPAPSEMEVSSENLRKLMPKLSKARADAIIAVMKAMGIPFDRLKLAKGKLEGKETLQQAEVKPSEVAQMTPAQAAEYFKRVKLISPKLARELLKGQVPEYLQPVAEFILRQRRKFLDGQMTARDVAKAYIITISSIRAGAIGADTITAKTDIKFPEYALMPGKAGAVIRPEDAVSAWLLTPDGKRALDSLEATGKVDFALWNPLLEMRQVWGNNTLKSWAFNPDSKGLNLHKIEELTRAINETKGDPKKLEAVVQQAVGIKLAKAGFIKHLLGFGDTPTIDAREINFWFTGQADIAYLKTKQAQLARDAKVASGLAGQAVVERLTKQINKLATEYGLDPNVGAHIIHHWLWDATSDEVTTHAVMMDAMELAQAEEASPLGSITFIDDLNALISVFEKANFSTVIHEAMHFYRRHMLNTENGFTADEIKRFERWAEVKNGKWTVAAEEKAARAFEKYLRDGLAPIPELRDLFRRVAQWMREVYATLTRSPVDIDIPADIRQVFDRIFTLEAERQGKAGGQAAPAAGTQSLQQADVKARDAEYMAAVKSGDTAKAQKMVDEAAKAAGYHSRRFYHGTPDGRFSIFEKDRGVHERGLGVFAFSDARNVANEFRGGLWVKRDGLTNRDDWVIGEEKGSAVKAYPKYNQVKEVYLDLSNPDVFDMGGGGYNEGFVSGAIKEAKKAKRTSIVFRNMRDASYTTTGRWPISNVVFVFNPNQIKSADPITYDDKGNVIPLSERFKPSTPDIRYQREGEGVPQAETATAVYRRAMKEQQQEKAAKALQSLNQPRRGVRKPATFAPAQPRPSLEITPVNRRAVVETMQELREFKRKLTEQKGGLAAATDADLDKWEKLLNRIEQLGGVNPITPQMDAKYQAVIDAGVVGERGRTVQAALDKAASTAFGVPEVTRVPDIRKWQAVDWEEEIDWQEDRVARRIVLEELEITEDDVDWNDIREEDVYILGFQDSDVWGEWDWEDIPDFEDVRQPTLLAYPRVKIAGKENAIGDLVHEFMILQGEQRMGKKASPAPLPLEVETGRPIVAQVFRGGTFEGTEFQSQFLGKLTNAQSARMGYFFAATPQTANAYTKAAERTVSPKIADSVATPATRPYYVYMSNPLVHDNESSERRTVPLPKLIRKALKDGHDGVIVKNIYDPVEDHVFIVLPGHENQIKSAEPETSDSRGNLIPLSERFNPATKNVLYQGEDPLPNVEGTSTEAFRRKQAEQRQKNLVDAMNRLRQGKGQTPPKTEGKSAQAATPPPTAQAAPKTAPPPKTTKEARQRKASIKAGVRNATQARRRGFGGKSLDEIFNSFVQRAKAGSLTPTETATEPEKLEERIQRGLRDVIRAAYELNLQDTAIADQAKRAAGEALAAQRTGDTAAQEKALQEFADIVAKSRELLRGPKGARPQKTVAQQYDDMLKRAQKPGKPYQAATPEERADMYIKRQIRKLQDLLKMAQQKGINVDTMEVNGKTVSRKDHFTQAAEDYRKAFLNQDHVGMSAAADRMRDATDSIISQLPKLKAMPLWYNLRSLLSYANVVGTYEGQMGELGRQISEAFMRVHSDIARDKVSFSEGLQRLQEQMNRVYKPLMIDEGYYGMPRVIDDHITYLRNSMAYNRALQKMLKEQADKNIKFLKNPMDWYVLRRDFARQRIGDQYGAFPLASAMLKSFIYTTKLKYNVKSAITQYASLITSVGPYMSPDQLAKIIAEAAKPSTANRKVDGDLTLRQVAVGESGGRQAEGAPAETTPSSWWHRGDVFQFTSEQVRIAGYLVGEEMVRREQAYLRQKGLPLLDEATEKRRIRDWVEKVEFDNSPWNMAPMFRGPVKGVLFQFKPFLQKNVERFIADMIRNPIGYQRGEARTPVGRLVNKLPDKVVRRVAAFGYQIGFGGISSALTLIPGLKNVAAPLILGGLTSALVAMGMDDDDAEEFAIAINYGFPAAIGMDLSSSLGFLDDIPGKTLAEQIVNFGLGPTVSTLAEIGKRTGELVETVQKPAKLGREEEKQAEVMRRAINIPKAVTPYARMFETAMDWVRGKPSTVYLDKEMELTPYEKVIRMLGGTPIRQTMFFDEKESYGWQKSLLGKPTGLDRLKKKEGEPDANYFQRKARADALEARYLPPLQNNPGFKALSKEDQDIVLDNLWRNIVEESDTPKPPNRSKFNPAVLVRTRKANIRAKAREERRKAREQMYYGGRAIPQE